jgi:signal transduction histidine kinase
VPGPRARGRGRRVDGDGGDGRGPIDLPLGVELAAYRIIKEALTNTRRHAHARTACVRLTYEATGLRIDITDDGRGTAAAGRGTG